MGEDRLGAPDPAEAASRPFRRTSPPFRYTSPEEDSARWWDFPLRPGDIVVSTRSKSGTTWIQTICLLLVFGTPRLPDPLGRLSPWLDWLTSPKDEVFALLAAQTHRRVVKTHTPLDGVPLDEAVTYVVVGRHPLDMAVSLYHHAGNIDRTRLAELTGRSGHSPQPEQPLRARPALHEWLCSFVEWDGDPRAPGHLDTLPGILLHLSDAWARREAPNVVLVHYDDLLEDLEGSMRRLAVRLGFEVDEARWPELVRAATFEAMKADPRAFVPDAVGVLEDPSAFFRHGVSGDGRGVLSGAERSRYAERAAALAPPDLLAWLHGEPSP